MKKFFALSAAISLLGACQQAAPVDTSAITEKLDALEKQVNGQVFGSCSSEKTIALDDYNASMEGLPDAKLESTEWHKAMGEMDNVMTTQSGLQYKVIVPGQADGAKPKPTDMVKVNYHGTFADGKMFDSSYRRNKPSDFQANGVIQGWVEALADMKPCEARTLFIPGKLAYGEQGRPGAIPPNATLVFNVQLLDIYVEGMKQENKKLKDDVDQLKAYASSLQQQLRQLATQPKK